MAWHCNGSTNQEMVTKLKDAGILATDKAEAAMLTVDRAKYCHEPDPYLDRPRRIGYNVTISAPHMHAYALSILSDQLFDGARALDVGSGSGYLSACMAFMVGSRGRVIGIEHIPELIEISTRNVREDNPHFLKESRIKFVGTRVIKSDKVFEAMSSVDRGKYTHPTHAYIDSPQGIGYGVTISAPHMHAYALELLEEKLRSGKRALDVGSGSGYLTTCMAIMMGPKGLAVGIEHIPELRTMAEENIRHDHPELLRDKRVELIVGDGRLGHADRGPYDAIHVGAAAKEMPQPLIDQLAPGGRLIVPMGPENSDQTLVQVDKTLDGKIKQRPLISVMFVPLTDKERQYCRSRDTS
ncbi:protein-L-isoaspartate(D-aspartate) O-methyltransferase isoform X2 [Linepithema humile]|uniref:protein-L-isoaspartate(D-aspartate) O-methyltransferase isoform X2 n=1 Tax=Linepithema humile TaxID=83485 RepID=UPI00351DE0E0